MGVYKLQSVVGGAIIGNEYIRAVKILHQHGIEAFREMSLRVIPWNQDAHIHQR